MVMRNVTCNSIEYTLDVGHHEFTFEDNRGKTIEFYSHFYADPDWYKSVGYTTRGGLLKWFAANRDRLPEWVITPASQIFLDISPRELKTATLTTLRSLEEGFLSHTVPSFNVLNLEGVDGEFRLIRQPEENTGPKGIRILRASCGHIEFVVKSPETGRRETEHGFDQAYYRQLNYTFKMDPDEYDFFRTVSSESGPFFGMELELCTKVSPKELQLIVTDVEPFQKPFFIMKQDSSVSGKYEHRYEVVTVPCTPRYLRREWKILFTKIERLCGERGLSVSDLFDTSDNLTNGIHIHISKESFSSMCHLRRFVTSMHQTTGSVKRMIQTFSQRPHDYTKHGYCPVNPDFVGRKLWWRLKEGMRSSGSGRTVCHTSNTHTVEVRVFQGIFDMAHLFRCVSFTQALMEYTDEIGYQDFDSKFVSGFKSHITKHKRFASLKEVFDKCA